MLHTTMIMLGLSIVLAIVSACWTFVNYRKHKDNLLVSRELGNLILETKKGLKQSNRMSQKKSNNFETRELPSTTSSIINSPEMMSTIITVLVNKFGDIRLSVNDFMISDDEYVSVYVDSSTQELILSLNSNLTLETQFVNFNKSDDNTYH